MNNLFSSISIVAKIDKIDSTELFEDHCKSVEKWLKLKLMFLIDGNRLMSVEDP